MNTERGESWVLTSMLMIEQEGDLNESSTVGLELIIAVEVAVAGLEIDKHLDWAQARCWYIVGDNWDSLRATTCRWVFRCHGETWAFVDVYESLVAGVQQHYAD